MDVFSRLAPYIQDYIYRNKWTELREVQVAACDVVFNTDNNLLLSSGTASGKTEAAFLPALTMLYEKPSKSVGIIYVSPLKALINDQFERLDLLLSEANVPVCKWHGDASYSAKNKLIKNPQGILQITPESLESLLINKREACLALFSDLRFIIIDEVHFFMSSPRGIQLLCQLERIQKLTNCNPRRIGLSATLGDYSFAEQWLNCGSHRMCSTLIVNGKKRKIGLSMQRFALSDDGTDDTLDSGIMAHMQYLYEKTRDKKAIIFANSRSEVETIIAYVRQIAERNHTQDIYHVHHGSISAALREETERDMKNADNPIVTGATVTLELGIDLGSLDRIVQVGAPMTASSFTQRVGRCGRRGQPSELLFTFTDRNLDSSTDSMRAINWEFIKTIAIIQLFLKEKWVEPITTFSHPYALLYHQTMSYLLSNGEVSAAELAQNVLGMQVFNQITKEDYKKLLIQLLEINQLEKTERGGIIIGLKGERVVSVFDFYSVFESPIEYLVKEHNRSIGTVSVLYPVGSKFALAGRTWETININEKAKVLFVKEAKGISKIMWLTDYDTDTHTHIYQQMKNVLQSKEIYAYLSESCKERLTQIRQLAAESQIVSNTITSLSNNVFAIFPWIGTRQLLTLYYALEQKGIKCIVKPSGSVPIYLEVYCIKGLEYLNRVFLDIKNSRIDKNNFELPEDIQLRYKYNQYIPKELLRKQFIEDYLITSIN
jgi:ATP-dependent Lhr-like helicase